MSVRRIALLLFALSLLVVIFGSTLDVAAQDEGPDAGSLRAPGAWNGQERVPEAQLSAALQPLVVVEEQGEFDFTRLSTPEGDVLRVQRTTSAADAAAPAHLELLWTLPDAELAGNIATLGFSARGYSPPDGLRVYIGDDAGGAPSTTSVTVADIGWQPYQIQRQIGADATEIRIGLDWRPTIDTAWFEITTLALASADAAGYSGELLPTDTPAPPTPTPTPAQIIVTSTPTPANVFEAATRVVQATQDAAQFGTATPTPVNMMTATFTPTPLVVTNTPTPANGATATALALAAEARAITTGTPTPFPADLVVLVATPTPATAPNQQATPLFVLLEDIPPTGTPQPTPAFPAELVGKIAFKANLFGNDRRPDYMIMNPDGTGVARLTGAYFYQRALERDHYSGDRRFYASVGREQDGFQRIQIFYDFPEFGTKQQLTFFGAGTAWDPAWSPVEERIVLVSNESRNDEIWIMERDQWPAIKLTENEWEWDNHPSFSPDGDQIVFMSNRNTGRRQLWIMNVDGTNQRQLTDFPFEAWDPVWIKYPDS